MDVEAGPVDDPHALTPAKVDSIVTALDEGDLVALRGLVEPLHAADLADLVEQIAPDERRALIEALRSELDPELLAELEGSVRAEVVEQLGPQEVAAALHALETDDAVQVLDDLDAEERAEVLEAMAPAARVILESGLAFPEDSAGRMMQRELVAVPQFWSVGRTLTHLRDEADLPDRFYEIFVVDPAWHVVGTVPLDRVLRAPDDAMIAAIMDREQQLIPATMDQEQVGFLFQKYRLMSAAVIDGEGRLIGMITSDDVADVIAEEVEEDVLRLGGVSGGDLAEPTLVTTGRRFSWLFVNLLTAILASAVISIFEATIQQVVALAVLMPIVASQGGNAATQTLTVAVRALATRELTATNAMRVVARESLVGLANGLLFAAIIGAIGGFWFKNALIGVVLAGAMVINMVVAGLAGVLVPLTLARFKVDPAIASGVFVTTVTDVVGFFAFLGLAALILV
jgi:magnesium transporter